MTTPDPGVDKAPVGVHDHSTRAAVVGVEFTDPPVVEVLAGEVPEFTSHGVQQGVGVESASHGAIQPHRRPRRRTRCPVNQVGDLIGHH